jgi:hypothetical protein
MVDWATPRVAPDCRASVLGALYTVPWPHIGQQLDVRATATTVEFFRNGELVKTWVRGRKGSNNVDWSDYPPDKIAFLQRTPAWCRRRAVEAGPSVAAVVNALLSVNVLHRLRAAQGILRLGERHGSEGSTPPVSWRSAPATPSTGPSRGCWSPVTTASTASPRPPATCRLPTRTRRPLRGGDPVTQVHQLQTTLRTLKLSGMLDTLDARLDQARAGELGHLEFLQVLCEDEIARRQRKVLGERIHRARFEEPTTLEDYDFGFNPKVPAAQIRDLASCNFIEEHESVILYGPVGVGKTHVAQALGHMACRRGFAVLFTFGHQQVSPGRLGQF